MDDEETAAEIFRHVQSDALPLFDALIVCLRGETNGSPQLLSDTLWKYERCGTY